MKRTGRRNVGPAKGVKRILEPKFGRVRLLIMSDIVIGENNTGAGCCGRHEGESNSPGRPRLSDSAMRQFAEANRAFLHGFRNSAFRTGHWNEKGHGLAAEIIARDLCANPL